MNWLFLFKSEILVKKKRQLPFYLHLNLNKQSSVLSTCQFEIILEL